MPGKLLLPDRRSPASAVDDRGMGGAVSAGTEADLLALYDVALPQVYGYLLTGAVTGSWPRTSPRKRSWLPPTPRAARTRRHWTSAG